jgi:hypothetical protein
MARVHRREIHFPSSAIGRHKKFGETQATPQYLQRLEMAQNRQRNVWKNLEKNRLDLERLGEKACRLGAPPLPPHR